MPKGIPKFHKLNTPRVHYVDENMLLIDFIPCKSKSIIFFKKLGGELAKMHKMTAKQFGFAEDNYIGGTKQVNDWKSSWVDFFWEKRLCCQVNLLEACYFPLKKRLTDLELKIKEVLHDSSPSLLHGDLWGGNVHNGPLDRPFLIDPAVYYGDREVDLAMTRLFGGFPEEFYKAYLDEFPIHKGYEKREIIYNLYHLFNHLHLFGSSYQSQIEQSLKNIEQGSFKAC